MGWNYVALTMYIAMGVQLMYYLQEGYSEIDPTMAFEMEPPAGTYEQPVKRIKQSPPKQTTNANTSNAADYDSPYVGSGTIPITTSHSLKLPADYDEVPGDSLEVSAMANYDEIVDKSHDYLNQQDSPIQEYDSGYHMLGDASTSPTSTHKFGKSVSNEYTTPLLHEPRPHYPSQSSNVRAHAQKAKTLALAAMDYETPLDANTNVKSHTIPANFQGNYETPLDA